MRNRNFLVRNCKLSDRFYVTSDLLREAECHREMRTGDHTHIEVMSKPREKGAWRFDDRLLMNVSEVARIQEVVAGVLRAKVNDDSQDVSVNMLQEFVNFQEHCPIDLVSEILYEVTSTMRGIKFDFAPKSVDLAPKISHLIGAISHQILGRFRTKFRSISHQI